MKLVLFGIQGAGKSTQGNLLSSQLKLPYLSTGHIFREMAKEKTPQGRYLKETMNAGILIPDDRVVPIVEEYLKKPIYRKGYILDGFPRTIQQIREFKNGIDKVIYIDVPEKEALWRIADRNDASRQDETVKAVKKRIESYYKSTLPVIEKYQKDGKLITVDGTKSIREVNNEILKSLGKELVKNKVREWEIKKKIVIALAGMPGAGKTEAANFLKSKKIPIISFSQVTNYITKHKMAQTEENHKKVREELRAKYGFEALAVLNLEEIKESLKKNPIILISNLRSWEEYKYLKQELKDAEVVIISIYADKHIRYKRIRNRKDRNKLYGEERDVNELIGAHMGSTIAFADYIVVNDTTLEEFHNKLEHVYQRIYFS